MKTINLSDEDFEYLRLMVRVRNNDCVERIQNLADFANDAQTHFDVSEEVREADAMILRGMLVGLETMTRIDIALEEALDAEDEPVLD